MKHLYTSYYAIAGDNPRALAISKRPPPYYTGKVDQRLSPTWELLTAYRSGKINSTEYTQWFLRLLKERNLDPVSIGNELPEGTVLLCYERPEEFCHRHIIASWLMEHNSSIAVEELKIMTAQEQMINQLLSFD